MEEIVMRSTVLRDRKGVTLVEVLVALVILLVVFMGLIQAALLSIENNAVNILRDEGVRLGSDTMAALRSSPFDDLDRSGMPPNDLANLNFIMSSTSGNATQVANARRLGINTRRTIRNVLGANYVIEVWVLDLEVVAPPNNINKQVTVEVRWDWKGATNRHRFVTLLRRI